MALSYALSTLYIVLKPFAWLDRTDRSDWGEGLGMSAIVSMVFFVSTYVLTARSQRLYVLLAA